MVDKFTSGYLWRGDEEMEWEAPFSPKKNNQLLHPQRVFTGLCIFVVSFNGVIYFLFGYVIFCLFYLFLKKSIFISLF